MICEFSENFLAFRFPLLAPPLQASTLTAILFFFFFCKETKIWARKLVILVRIHKEIKSRVKTRIQVSQKDAVRYTNR